MPDARMPLPQQYEIGTESLRAEQNFPVPEVTPASYMLLLRPAKDCDCFGDFTFQARPSLLALGTCSDFCSSHASIATTPKNAFGLKKFVIKQVVLELGRVAAVSLPRKVCSKKPPRKVHFLFYS